MIVFLIFQICETYQIIGGEYKNRLLALVAHGDTSAIVSFASSKWPPELFSDLTIESLYPLNGDFMLDTSMLYVLNVEKKNNRNQNKTG